MLTLRDAFPDAEESRVPEERSRESRESDQGSQSNDTTSTTKTKQSKRRLSLDSEEASEVQAMDVEGGHSGHSQSFLSQPKYSFSARSREEVFFWHFYLLQVADVSQVISYFLTCSVIRTT